MKSFVESTPSSTRTGEAAKSLLRDGFEQFLDKLSSPELLTLAKAENRERIFDALHGTLSQVDTEKLSPRVRNQIAYAKGRALALDRVKSSYELLDSRTACEVLGISRQALSKKVQQGQVLAYADGAKKHYPAFQFEHNAVLPGIARLLTALALDPRDETTGNLLLGFLAQEMDFANPGEAANPQPRYALLGDEAAFDIIVRDFRNRLAMGR
ncbi:MAG: hypothetical protein LBJ37_10905 [Paucimonas sp.]|jgi:hypothetical protein|nr:hypothetical protein [Paucimonas sp.]